MVERTGSILLILNIVSILFRWAMFSRFPFRFTAGIHHYAQIQRSEVWKRRSTPGKSWMKIPSLVILAMLRPWHAHHQCNWPQVFIGSSWLGVTASISTGFISKWRTTCMQCLLVFRIVLSFHVEKLPIHCYFLEQSYLSIQNDRKKQMILRIHIRILRRVPLAIPLICQAALRTCSTEKNAQLKTPPALYTVCLS
jgi:hypothetical protein